MGNPQSKILAVQYEKSVRWANWKLNLLSDDDLKREVSPGKNHGIWLFGHLIANEDDFGVFLGKRELAYPEYQNMFAGGTKPLPYENYPSVSEMREIWKEMIEKNKKIYNELTDGELNEPHALIHENDFCKTKEDIIMHWQIHLVYHTGQLGILVPNNNV